MKIVAIRHLPTKLNAAGMLQGRRDEVILEPDNTLQQEIIINRQRLQEMPSFDQVLVSRLQRTAMTADLYGYAEQKHIEPLLDELDFGLYEGKLRSEFLATIGTQWTDAPQTVTLGEPVVELADRINQLLRKYRELDSLLIFGHAAWIRALMSIADSGDIELMNHFSINNNELCTINIHQD